MYILILAIKLSTDAGGYNIHSFIAWTIFLVTWGVTTFIAWTIFLVTCTWGVIYYIGDRWNGDVDRTDTSPKQYAVDRDFAVGPSF